MDNIKIEKTLILAFVGMVLGVLGLIASLVIRKDGNLILAAFFTVLMTISVLTTIIGIKKVSCK